MTETRPEPVGDVWEKNPVIAAAMLGALRDNPLTQALTEPQRMMLVERALRDQCRGDHSWLSIMVPRVLAGENLLEGEPNVAAPAAAQPAAQPHPEIHISRPVQVQSQAELETILEAHKRWIKQVLEPGQDLGPGRANFKGSDLRSFILDGADLRAANLEGCVLTGVSLIAANLAGANLAGAQLEDACLQGARLRRANLSGARLTRACLRDADLRQAQLKGAQLDAADLSGALGWTESSSL